ncbi:MAG: hypothetical protein WB610_03400 [Rhodomicrobium sp.]
MSVEMSNAQLRNLTCGSADRGLMTLTAGLRVIEGPEPVVPDKLELVENFLVSRAPVRIGKSVALVIESGERFLGLRGRLSAEVDCRGEQDGAGDQQ